MEKTRDLFKKIRNTKRTFHAKMGAIKDKNGIDLTEAEDTKKRWQECEEGGSAYAKAGSSLRGHPGNSRASTPKTRVCLPYCIMLSPTPLTLRWGCPPTTFFWKKLI